MKTRKYLSANGLIRLVKQGFGKIKDHRAKNIKITLKDALMSAYAMFSLKDPSLLAFDNRRQTDSNLGRVYGIKNIPSDSQMRTILDEVNPEILRPVFKDVFRQLQRGKELEKMVFLGGYLTSMDGTIYFTSKTIHCSDCLEKKSKGGEITYSHYLLGISIVHPERAEVIPLPPEPIIKQDGEKKNDCERNAGKRILAKLRQEHPHLPFIIIEDALSSNAPHIRELQKHKMRFILGVKESDHTFLFDYVRQAEKEGRVSIVEIEEGNEELHRFRFINQVPLNASHQDLLINFVEHWEITPKKTLHFSWVTDIEVSNGNVMRIMRGGRARWKIENETFNTLKNQGYHFEHNYGHGDNHLSVVFAMLMMLAFLVDQTQQLACHLFQAVLQKEGSRRSLWEHMRALFRTLDFSSFEDLWRAQLYGYKITGFKILDGL